MATSNVSQIPHQSTFNNFRNFKFCSTKEMSEIESLNNLTSIPSNYVYFSDPISSTIDRFDNHDYSLLPIIDLSFLESNFSDQRSKVVQDLGKACQDWGFFMVVNHGIPELLMNTMIDKCDEFFNLTTEEKQEYEGKHVSDPIIYGTSFNSPVEQVNLWRDYLKVTVHPHFHSPTKPHKFSETSSEYCKQVRRIARALLRGISLSLGFDEMEIEKSMDLDMGLQTLAVNYYPPCPQPNLAIGMPPHTDHGLLTILAQNQLGGLQILHNGKWVPVHALPNCLLVITSDQLEILSNGKYKSVIHRAVLNNKATRISFGIANGPSSDTIVRPAAQLTHGENSAPVNYKPMVYKEYILLQKSKQLNGNTCLDNVRA